jgi:tyrosine-protein kinase Etk/Wzc
MATNDAPQHDLQTNERMREESMREEGTRDVNVWHYLQILMHWRRFLVVNVGIIVAITVAITLLMPNRYRSTASVLAPKQESGMGSAISQLTKDFLPGGMLGKLGANQGAYNYLAILNSRRAKEAVVRKFDLTTIYQSKNGSVERAVRELEGYCSFDLGENGDVIVSVTDEDPKRAAAMTNHFVETLNTISVELSTQEAKNNRLFLEKRYNQARDDMRAVEDSMKAFQKRHGIYAMPEQTKAAIEGAAELQAQATVAEVELDIIRRSLGPDNPEARLKETEIRALGDKLRTMKFGSGSSDLRDADMFIPFKDVPELGMQYLRLYREYEIQNRIQQLVIPMYEQAKVEEQKTTPVVLVLDAGVPSEKKDAPKRMFIVLAAAIMGFLVFSFFVYLMASLLARTAPATSIEQSMRNGVARLARLYRVRM